MRKIISLVMTSLNGYYDGPGDGLEKLDWHHADDEWADYSVELLSNSGTLLFGRKTYQGFAQYWPSQPGDTARLLNALPKVVVSGTLAEASWPETRVVRDNIAEQIGRLKAEPGKQIVMFGSADLASTLTVLGLIDEYRTAVNPVVLAGGTRLYNACSGRRELELIGVRVFRSGLVELRHAPEQEA